ACISRYEEKTQLYSENPPRREAMLGIAVATIVPSIAARNIATTSALSTSDRRVRRGTSAVRSALRAGVRSRLRSMVKDCLYLIVGGARRNLVGVGGMHKKWCVGCGCGCRPTGYVKPYPPS